MGAEEVMIPSWSDDDILTHFNEVCAIPESWNQDILRFCGGQIHRANMIIQRLALQKRIAWSKEQGKFHIDDGLQHWN